MKKFAAAALLGAAVIGAPALAQNNPPAAPAPTHNATTTHNTVSDSNMALKGDWRASKLIGLNVYNENNDKLGDINELIVNKEGKIAAVVIGVGGFLGMGEHDIAVSMDKLKFVEEPVRTSSTAPARTSTTTGAAPAPATTTTTTSTAKANANDWTPDHAVLANATKDQLKSMPQFKYSDYNK